jgi:integrase
MAARAYTPEEYSRLENYFATAADTRGHLLLVLGCNTGLRITELLSLTVADCWTGSEVRPELFVARRRLKGGKGVHRRAVSGRRIPLAQHVRDAIAAHLRATGEVRPGDALFRSRQSGAGSMTRWHAHRILRAACAACGIAHFFVSTHSLRKTFAQLCYQKTRCLLTTQRCLAHRSPLTTAVYLNINQDAVDRTILDLTAPAPAPAEVIPLPAAAGVA